MQSSPADRSRVLLVSALLYFAMTGAMAWPVLGRLGTSILGDPGDPLLNAAILAWNSKNVPFTDAWWNFPIFFPAGNTLTFSENLLGVAIFTTPMNWITGNPLVAYNSLVLLSFPLSALSMWALVYRLTRVPAAALLAGLAFGFAPYRIAHLPHVQVLASFWMPLALLGLHAFIETRRRRWLLLFGASWLLQGTTNGYFLIFFSVFVAGWAGWFLLPARRWRDLASVVLAGSVAALPLIPILYRYVRAHAALGLSRDFGEVTTYSADIGSVLCAPSGLRFWGWLDVTCKLEGRLFPGAALVVVLVAVSIVRFNATTRTAFPRPGSWLGAFRTLCATIALAFASIAMATLLFGTMSIVYGPVRVSVSRFDKPLSVALLFALAFLVTGAPFRDRLRRSSVPGFYGCAAAVTWLLSLGPFPALLGTPVLYQAPYAWLMIVPGVDGLRVPARWWMLTILSLSVVLGVLIAAALRHRSRRVVGATVVVVAAGLLSDGWVSALPAAEVAASGLEAAGLEGRVVLKLPAGNLAGDVEAVYRAVNGNWRSVNGYSGYEPPHYDALRLASDRADDSVLAALRKMTDLVVIVAKDTPELMTLVSGTPGAAPAGHDANYVWYVVPRQASTVQAGAEVPIQRVDATCGSERIAALTDRDAQTFWECGLQRGNETLLIDLGRETDIGSVVHLFGRRVKHHPRTLVVETSVDGVVWGHGRGGSVLGEVFEAAITDPKRVPAVLSFTPRVARFVRLRQVGSDPERVWSVAEIEVRRPR